MTDLEKEFQEAQADHESARIVGITVRYEDGDEDIYFLKSAKALQPIVDLDESTKETYEVREKLNVVREILDSSQPYDKWYHCYKINSDDKRAELWNKVKRERRIAMEGGVK